MKWIIGLGIGIAVLLVAKKVFAGGMHTLGSGIDPTTGKPYTPGSLFDLINRGQIPFTVQYPPGAFSSPTTSDSRDAKTGGFNVKTLCQQAYGANGAAVSAIPDKNAKYVNTANTVLSDINCGAIGYAEKAIGKAYSLVKNLF